MNTRIAALSVSAAAVVLAAGTFFAMGGAGAPGASAPALNAAPAPAEAKTYSIDNVHSSVIFKVKHMNVASFYGAFKEVSGSFTLGDTGAVSVTVKADSVDTRNAGRDTHVKSSDYFSAKEFPDITFTAKDLKKSGDSYKGSGELSFRGVKKTIEVEIQETGRAPGRGGGEIAGIESTFKIKTSDFGMTSKGLGEEVTLMVAFEGK